MARALRGGRNVVRRDAEGSEDSLLTARHCTRFSTYLHAASVHLRWKAIIITATLQIQTESIPTLPLVRTRVRHPCKPPSKGKRAVTHLIDARGDDHRACIVNCARHLRVRLNDDIQLFLIRRRVDPSSSTPSHLALSAVHSLRRE